MVDDCSPDKVLDRIKEITGIGKFDDTKILIGTDDKLPDDVTLENVMILMMCVRKYGDEFYPQIFLEVAL